MNKDAKNTKNINNNAENETGQDNKNSNSESSFVRKLKYGSVAMIFTVVFIAVIFILNIVVTAINNVRPMMIDMTKEQIYGITDASRELLADVKEPIEIVFFMPKDLYEKSVPGGKMIVNCIMTFANEYDNITIKEVDIIKNPGIQKEFKTSDASQLSTTSIAVRSQGKPKLLSYSAFFITYQSTGRYGAFAGEKTLTSAILQAVSVDSPKVYFTMGHSESFPIELGTLFVDNGFIVDGIDLSINDIPDDARILVICNPQKDFIGASPDDQTAQSEIDKVGSFLNHFGSVMYFSSPDIGPLPELDDLLKEYGMAFEHDYIVIDDTNSLNNSRYNISADYFEANNVGDELTASIRKLPSLPKTIMPRVKPIQILNIASERDVSPVLTSFSTSARGNVNENTISDSGISNLLVVAQKTQYIDNNPKTSLFLVSGSYEFLGYLLNSSFGNSDIILNAMRIMTSKKVVVDIKWKEFDSTALNMTTEEQFKWMIITILVLPSIVSILGIFVWIRRRHS